MKTEVVIVLDKSGSMQSVADATRKGLNSFIKEQASIEGECCLTINQFNGHFEAVYKNIPIAEAPPLTVENYRTSGGTALYDAIGYSIDEIDQKVSMMLDWDKPDKVIVVIVTDGQENVSKHYKLEQVINLIDSGKANGWDFVFLGADQDAIKAGGRFGISGRSSMSVTKTDAGKMAAYASVSASLSRLRTGEATEYAFTDSDRELQASFKRGR